MEHAKLEQPVLKAKPIPPEFVDSSSLRSYAVATAALTVVLNLVLYVYNVIADGKVMPNKLLLPIAIALSLFYILSFFKRDPGNTLAQYCWITGLNSIMLFTSISGANTMLDKARDAFVSQGQKQVSTASFGDFFVHLVFPTHGWFSTRQIILTPSKEEVTSITMSLDTTQRFIDTLLVQKKNDLATINQLHTKVDSLQTNFIATLDAFSKVKTHLVAFQDSLRDANINFYTPEITIRTIPKIEENKTALVQQQQVQKIVQQQQRQAQMQEIKKLELQQLQIGQQQQQIQQIQSKMVNLAQKMK
jgi:hypothetical protein